MIAIIRNILLTLAICVCGSQQCRSENPQIVILNGSCPSVAVLPNFDISSYLGLWYEVAKYPAPFENGGKCITATYGPTENGVVKVLNSQINTITQTPIDIVGTATPIENAKLLVQFPGQPTPKGSNYWVLDTDYTNYSVVFSCTEISATSHSEIVWILSRQRTPSVDNIIKAIKVLISNNLSLQYLSATNQTACA